MTTVAGRVEPGFEPVREAFAANFEQHGDVGAAFCLYLDGKPVVDLWGGVADRMTGREWSEDTVQLVFSTTKGATAICALLLAERGELDLDAPVSDYWPEFKAEGKEDIPVRWLLCHKSGLPVVDPAPTPEQLLDWGWMVDALAAQKPYWEPGSAQGYHALTYGWLVGEVVRRVSGRSLGQFFADEVAAPLGLDFWIGLPEEQEPRVSRLEQLGDGQSVTGELDVESLPEGVRDIVRQFLDPNSITQRALTVCQPALNYNERRVHEAEIGAANGICTARSLARMYSALVGDVDGQRLLKPETVEQARSTQAEGPDKVIFFPLRFGLGFMLPSALMPISGPGAFGHAGAGGSLGFGDVDRRIGFGYVMNKMQQNLTGDMRTRGVIDAVLRCI